MTKRYNPTEIEQKWQKFWDENKTFGVEAKPGEPKSYVQAMFPYPSGAGLHVGHVRNYSITDAIARYERAKGKHVLSAMGWDAFGLPAENYAIKTGVAPADSTKANIANFKTQLKRLGVSYDWSREFNTTDPSYYRWTQWLFLKFFEKGLAYQKESLQWWCPVCKTVLANEQVINGGYCWRHEDTMVEKKWLKQWFFKITDYADELLDGLDALDWPEKIKAMQRNWIGKSKGAEVRFQISDDRGQNKEPDITVFTTRPDTIYGATFLVLAPEHPLVREITSAEQSDVVEDYIREASLKSDIDRMSESREKTGVFTGAHAVNPATNEEIPVWIADYVLMGYGTGAIMAVPGHDERDSEFAKKFELPIVQVVDTGEDIAAEGTMTNSGEFDGMSSSEAREKIVAKLDGAEEKTNYRMRDWLISRQRYWGAPIPIIHCEKDGAVAVPEDQLPVELPPVENYEPKGDGKSVLAHVPEWYNVDCPKCGGPAVRETDTLDGYVCSSWYIFRFADASNDQAAWDPAKANYWAPMDFYCGGDHAVAHLLYVRFWTKFLSSIGMLEFDEPIKQLVYNGYINAHDGQKMSKSKGNVVDPLELIDQGYGADALRVYELFIGPYEQDAAWDPKGIAGTYRFLSRVWTLTQEFLESDTKQGAENRDVIVSMHKAVKRITDDLERHSFNTAVAALMEYVNELYKLKVAGFEDKFNWHNALTTLTQLLEPFAPHIAQELWQQLGHEGYVHDPIWPTWDNEYLVQDTITVVVQVNGKVRAELSLPKDVGQEDAIKAALENEKVREYVTGEPKKTIYVPGKLVSLVV